MHFSFWPSLQKGKHTPFDSLLFIWYFPLGKQNHFNIEVELIQMQVGCENLFQGFPSKNTKEYCYSHLEK